jgi:two-component system sensor histidine kinase RegB
LTTAGFHGKAGLVTLPASTSSPPRAPTDAVATDAPGFAPAVTLAWLVRLRWGAVLAQAVTVLVASLALGRDLPSAALALLVGITAASNVALRLWLRTMARVRTRVIGGVLLADTALLTALLYFSGGPSNPFSVLYLVYVTLAALTLGAGWAAAVVVVTATGYALLFFESVPIAGMEHMHHHGTSAYSFHLQAMWVAFTVTAGLVGFFVARMQRALRDRDAQLAQAHRLAARSEKLASLTALAAGAAHELGTPLGTIAVAARELERALGDDPGVLASDARLIRDEVDRCRRIVQQMSGRSGETMGEVPEDVSVETLASDVRARTMAEARLVVRVDPDVPAHVTLPGRGLAQALSNLVKNALEASEGAEDDRVELSMRRAGASIRFEVVDHGPGIEEADLSRVGEPFFSTKAPGKGMGLGLFLAHVFAERWRGRLVLESVHGHGTRACIELPVA